MCGIAGVLDRRAGADPDAVERQLATVRHRGPDASGVYRGGEAVIGQNRLRIVDLVCGDPPVTNEDGSVGAVLNGEIYNFGSLREELLGRGHRLETHGDTEVLAHLAEDVDPVELAGALHGMFAFAVWDRRRRRLVLGRDRLGKKPLYYWHNESTLVFGSEIKAVLAHPAVPARLNEAVVPAYLAFGYAPTPSTFYDGVLSVPPGHVLVVDGDGPPRLFKYWTPPLHRGTAPLTAGGDITARVRSALADAVTTRLVADVPLGAFLSGGIDSSAVVALMAQASPTPVRTFTIGFDENRFDERRFARLVADRFRTDHTEFVVRPDAVSLLDELVWHHDQPFGDSSAIPTYLLSKLTRQHVTVALSGDGGDELFAGYERFAAALTMDAFRRVPSPVRRPAARLVQRAGAGRSGTLGKLARFAGEADRPVADAYLGWVRIFSPEVVDRLVPNGATNADREHRATWRGSEGAPLLSRLLDLNLRTYLLDDLLVKVDRMSMAHALEVRSPLLDHRLVELAATIPPRDHVRGLSLKRVLRAAVADLLPPEILQRGKKGFGVPVDQWFEEALRPLVTSQLLAPDARVKRMLDAGSVDDLVGAHLAGRARHGHRLWTLLTLEAFLRRRDW